MVPPRTGPQGVSMEDLRRAAGATRPPASRLATTPRGLPIEQTLSTMVGGPLPTAGKKYGGFPTAELAKTYVIGQLQGAVDLENFLGRRQQDLSTQAANRYLDLLTEQYAPNQRITGRPGEPAPVAFEEYETPSRLGPMVQYRPTEYTRGVEDAPAVKQAATNLFRAKVEELAGRQTGAGIREAEANLARATRDEVSRRRASEMGARVGYESEYERAVLPVQQTLSELQSIPRSQLAQQIATTQLGYSPALAAGEFGGEFNREQMLREFAQQGVYPDQSVGEYILMNEGPEAFAQFQQNEAQLQLNKQAETFRTAEDERRDLALEQAVGVPVEVVAGKYDLGSARAVMNNPAWVRSLSEAVTNLQNETDAMTVEEKTAYARRLASGYTAILGPVQAQMLLNALLSFEFLLGYEL